VNLQHLLAHATAMELLLFDAVDDARPAQAIRIDPIANRTYPLLARFRAGRAGQGKIYGYRVEGHPTRARLRFDYDRCSSTRTGVAWSCRMA